MNEAATKGDPCCGSITKWAAWTVGVLGSFVVLGAITYFSVRHDPSPALDARREAVRYQARRDLESAVSAEVTKFAIDGTKANKAQLSVSRAMEVLLAEWKGDSSAGRVKLLERLEASKKDASFE